MEKENIDTYKLLSSFDKLRWSLTTKDDKCINGIVLLLEKVINY